MRVILTGGGSGGHVNPALAIGHIIKMNVESAEILFVGTSKGIENTLVPKAGYEIRHIEISGIKRSLSPANIKTAIRIVTSQLEAKKLLKEFKPDIVIGTGGYACWPCVKVAADMGIPTVLHEANATPGFAVKTLCHKVDAVLTNFDETIDRLKNCRRSVRVGMPMRGEFDAISKEKARKELGIDDKYKRVILSFGGSLGATEVNKASIEVMRDFSAHRADVIHYHATGKREYEDSFAIFKEAGLEGKENLCLSEYIYDMSLKMAAADLVICRSGAMTLAELARLSCPALLIPSPNVTDNHQYKNAKVLADAGAAVIIEEKEFDGSIVTNTVADLINDDARRAEMAENMATFYDKETGKKIFSEIERAILSKKADN